MMRHTRMMRHTLARGEYSLILMDGAGRAIGAHELGDVDLSSADEVAARVMDVCAWLLHLARNGGVD